jgi:hypothetical protein
MSDESTSGEEDFYIVVWRDGSYLIADGRLQANEYEQDEDWLATFSLNEMVAKTLIDTGRINVVCTTGASATNE